MSAALNSETQLDRLLKVVLDGVVATTKARAGALYLFDDRDWSLRRSQCYPEQDEELAELLSIDSNRDHPAIRAMTSRRSYVSPDGKRMAVPLETLADEFVGALVLELSVPMHVGEAGGPHEAQLAFIEALSSTAAVAIETRHLVDSQKELIESLIQLLAGAIDAKSPYTGGHCQRVPELTKMLVRAAHDCEEGAWQEFRLEEADWEAVHVGAWLHDCGKITTPEFVVDKATKLETIYNRIHEIRMRFEVLKRDAEIQYWRKRSEGVPEQEAWDLLRIRWREIDDDFAFVAECNVGGEFMDGAKVERLKKIAEQPWMRTMDDRLGLSREEQRAVGNLPQRPLPAMEMLLADKPEHLVERLPSEQAVQDGLGFKVTPPRYKFNRGELYNLAISRGTLTDEERYIINDHIVQSITMLEKLPFPKHLRNVPEIAGGHHERMDGRGYPKGLTRDQMSVPARIMAIADVFEALTAADRPYKPAKTLSESLMIMARMAAEHHLDVELFVLFLQSGVYQQYADRYLLPTQFDEVDVAALIDKARSGKPLVVPAPT
ncbi:MAG: HD domain-containing phosphohydrolase [Rhodocyclaceae bacterium]